MKRIIELGALLAGVGLLQGCSGEGSTPEGALPATPEQATESYWHLEAHDYPYLGETGRTVCRRRTHTDPNGDVQVDQEEYDFALMNDLLAGRAEIEPGVLDGLHAAGLTEVSTCDDARQFTAVRGELRAELPSEQTTARSVLDASPEGQEDKVAFGYQDNRWGYSVRFKEKGGPGWCSGILIGPTAMITAQHCVANWTDSFIYVDYGLNTTLPCISDWCDTYPPSSWTASTPSFANAKIYRYPGYTGEGDTQDDLAVVVHDYGGPSTWHAPADTSDHWIRMLHSFVLNGDQFWIFGYGYSASSGGGTGDGISRVSNYEVPIESYTKAQFTYDVETNGTRGCHGDSGGGAINDTLFTNDVVLGLLSNATGNGANNPCPGPGATEHWVGLYLKTSWIRDQIVNLGAGSCIVHQGGNGDYMRCW